MTNITFKALSKISTILATSVVLTLPIMTASNAEISFDDGHSLTICVLDGGNITNNGTTRTCTNPATNAVTECDNSKNGDVDACSTDDGKAEGPTRGKHIKSVANSGDTMIMQPDTNTTVGTRTKSLGSKMTIRNAKRK